MDIINKTKFYFLDNFEKSKNLPYQYLARHVFKTEKWANKILSNHPEADRETVLLAVWLHDIGQIIGEDTDHAVNSENEVRLFLPQLKVAASKIGEVAHCVRAHKCTDIQPRTIEAKILAVANSVSHMTDSYYICMVNKISRDVALKKLKKDCEISLLLSEMKEEIKPFCKSWKDLLKSYPV
jgi:hypothetical protein